MGKNIKNMEQTFAKNKENLMPTNFWGTKSYNTSTNITPNSFRYAANHYIR